MIVKELIEELKLYDENLEVYTDDEEEVIGLYRMNVLIMKINIVCI